MPGAPAFWSRDGLLARLLSPLSSVGAAMTARRVARPGWQAPVPVICCGNVTVGGAGKTTLVLDLARRLADRGHTVHVLLRGYGGDSRGVHRVAADDPAARVGDEALLLAAAAPTWIGADRAASAREAVAAGAQVLLMDDGLQNPTLAKTFSILVIDGRTGFGNGRVLPAGPLREPIAAAAARCQAVVLIGADATGALARLPPHLPVLRADLRQDTAIGVLAGQRVLAFAGIAIPDKFFAPLRQAGAVVTAARPFPDHHPYTAGDLAALERAAAALDARLVTTPKDAVRLPPEFRARVTVICVGLVWENADRIEQCLDSVMRPRPPGSL
ncbi:tetraacyldisaccharide 4'-kinase [Rhodopila globiformis]|uniref:Tetraacyldisaccharide 4'-kinase n=1 Tax=Rhodopila globiformis TaxID=1071 RepID=A0A2S6MYK6_RHOGL|nr:tetraacyldisaccharide 4'-kinase [Rhodopila globiformis]PPQ27432.1 tetraacyldisaccharide 4'-kinase [Rhodopila globiformis]